MKLDYETRGGGDIYASDILGDLKLSSFSTPVPLSFWVGVAGICRTVDS